MGRLSPSCLGRPACTVHGRVPPGASKTGYVEGQNPAIEYRRAEGHSDRLPALAADDEGAGPPRGKCRLVDVEESSLEGRDIKLSVSPKDIRTSPYDLCANRSDRRESREGTDSSNPVPSSGESMQTRSAS